MDLEKFARHLKEQRNADRDREQRARDSVTKMAPALEEEVRASFRQLAGILASERVVATAYFGAHNVHTFTSPGSALSSSRRVEQAYVTGLPLGQAWNVHGLLVSREGLPLAGHLAFGGLAGRFNRKVAGKCDNWCICATTRGRLPWVQWDSFPPDELAQPRAVLSMDPTTGQVFLLTPARDEYGGFHHHREPLEGALKRYLEYAMQGR